MTSRDRRKSVPGAFIGLLMQVEHVRNVVITSPTHDVILSPGQLASMGTVNVTVERVDQA